MQKIIRNFASISLENCVCVNRNIENTATAKEKQESKCKKIENFALLKQHKPSKSKFNKLVKQFVYGYCSFWSF